MQLPSGLQGIINCLTDSSFICHTLVAKSEFLWSVVFTSVSKCHPVSSQWVDKFQSKAKKLDTVVSLSSLRGRGHDFCFKLEKQNETKCRVKITCGFVQSEQQGTGRIPAGETMSYIAACVLLMSQDAATIPFTLRFSLWGSSPPTPPTETLIAGVGSWAVISPPPTLWWMSIISLMWKM